MLILSAYESGDFGETEVEREADARRPNGEKRENLRSER